LPFEKAEPIPASSVAEEPFKEYKRRAWPVLRAEGSGSHGNGARGGNVEKTPFLAFRRKRQREVATLFHQLQVEYEELRRIVNRPALEPEMLDLARAAHSRIGAVYGRLAELLGETGAEFVACAVYLWVLNSETC
jgi:hypothetical protein